MLAEDGVLKRTATLEVDCLPENTDSDFC